MSAVVGARLRVTTLTSATPAPRYLVGLFGEIPVKLLLVIISSLWHKSQHEVFMLKFLVLFCLITATIHAEPIGERFDFDEHQYIYFHNCWGCKAVLHDPECHRCRFIRYVAYDRDDPFDQPVIIERVEVSPLRYNIPTQP